ncbi:hypothetical protein A4X13_0g9097, partial [Tilletia indica]
VPIDHKSTTLHTDNGSSFLTGRRKCRLSVVAPYSSRDMRKDISEEVGAGSPLIKAPGKGNTVGCVVGLRAWRIPRAATDQAARSRYTGTGRVTALFLRGEESRYRLARYVSD